MYNTSVHLNRYIGGLDERTLRRPRLQLVGAPVTVSDLGQPCQINDIMGPNLKAQTRNPNPKSQTPSLKSQITMRNACSPNHDSEEAVHSFLNLKCGPLVKADFFYIICWLECGCKCYSDSSRNSATNSKPLLLPMSWSRENVFALLALFATCVPIFILATTLLLRRRQRHFVMGGKCL
jgi:hypothetical protein